ncbi:MAG TPA: T9SS type A sorting domain-containing protein [Candidatus Cloacimonadota bacterium]|nr:T9SS type A sorting domain-containing protein [Candidatus Cloacimonadota bacterium]
MRNLLACLILLFSLSLTAQSLSQFMDVRHSARDGSGNVHIRFNSMDEGLSAYNFFYRDGDWSSAPVSQINPGEFEALIPYVEGTDVPYIMSKTIDSGAEAVTFLQPPFYSAVSFPPTASDMASFGLDAIGDSVSIYSPVLDIVRSTVTANDTGLYRAIQNQTGTYPTMNSLTSYNLWMSVIANPLALADSVAFAMIYTQNILGIISPGLYKIGMDQSGVPSFERLGNIQSQVSGGILYMACNWADLAADPQFGAWPNDLNTLMCTDASMNITITLPSMTPAFNFGDYGAIGMVEFVYHNYHSLGNQLPVPSWNSYDSVTGAYDISYTDADQDFPLMAKLVEFVQVGSEFVYTYTELSPSDMDVESGIYRFVGSHIPSNSYFFQFSDNNVEYVILNAFVSNSDAVLPQAGSLKAVVKNPFSRSADRMEITISGLDKSPLLISLYNLKGQKILQLPVVTPKQETECLSWSPVAEFKSLSTGLYLIRIEQDKRVQTQKIMITR